MRIAWALVLCLLGCDSPFAKEHFDHTPDGWKITWKDQGTLSTSLHTKAEVYALFDAAMIRACAEVEGVYGLPAGTVRHRVRKDDTLFEIRDHFYFDVLGRPIDAPDAQYATGETMSKSWVILTFWNLAGGVSADPASIPATAPTWTALFGPNTQKWWWGEEVPGEQYPALSYELHWLFSQDAQYP